MRDLAQQDRGDAARAYLARARELADRANAHADQHSGRQFSPEDARRLATMNALAAIAITQVPEEPEIWLT